MAPASGLRLVSWTIVATPPCQGLPLGPRPSPLGHASRTWPRPLHVLTTVAGPLRTAVLSALRAARPYPPWPRPSHWASPTSSAPARSLVTPPCSPPAPPLPPRRTRYPPASRAGPGRRNLVSLGQPPQLDCRETLQGPGTERWRHFVWSFGHRAASYKMTFLGFLSHFQTSSQYTESWWLSRET